MNTTLTTSLDKLVSHKILDHGDFVALLNGNCRELRQILAAEADKQRRRYFGNRIYIRGLIEFTNYCKNNCLYCGIRCANQNVDRYRLTKEDILLCCADGYDLGFRTFVLQGGEDPYYTDDRMEDIVSAIHSLYPDCAITLSLGERSYTSYKRLFDAGADRYLLRHETANPAHYAKLHPASMSYEHRMACLDQLHRLSCRLRIHGRISFPDTGRPRKRLVIHSVFPPSYGWDRTIYSTRRYSICRIPIGYIRGYTAVIKHHPSDTPKCITACDDGTRHDLSKRA